MEACEGQRRCRRGRWRKSVGHRAAGRGTIFGRRGATPAGRTVPAAAGAAAVHSEERWEAAAAGDTDGARPGGASGSQACAGAHLRGGFPELFVWVPAAEGGDGRAGDDSPAWGSRPPGRRGRGYPTVLRPAGPDEAAGPREAADIGPAGVEAPAAVARGGGDGGGDGEEHTLGNTAGWRS